MSMQDKTRIFIVGMGNISRQMVGVLKTKPWYYCAGAVDVNDASLAAGREIAGLPESALCAEAVRRRSAGSRGDALCKFPQTVRDARSGNTGKEPTSASSRES